MTRRILIAREQLEMLSPWHQAAAGTPIYRGMSLDLSKTLYHPEMGRDILKSLKSLGGHWSYNREVAEDAAGWEGDPVILHARWRGMSSDVNPALPVGDEDDPDAYYPDEEEVPLHQGTPLDIYDVHVVHPETGEFHSVFHGTPVRHVT